VAAATPATGTNTGSTDMAVEKEFYKIYPNPTSGAFTLELSEGTENSAGKVEIYGMKGEKVLNYQFTGGNKHEFTLDGKPVGIYFIRILYGDQTGVAKIIKE
jgi:hypothetical protein